MPRAYGYSNPGGVPQVAPAHAQKAPGPERMRYGSGPAAASTRDLQKRKRCESPLQTIRIDPDQHNRGYWGQIVPEVLDQIERKELRCAA